LSNNLVRLADLANTDTSRRALTPGRDRTMRATTRLRRMLEEPGIVVAPGAYDGISARLVEAAGFRAVYMTGAGTAASHIGQPDLGLTTLTEMATHAGHLASCVSLPVIADADTGFGNALNVVRTVREYERAGVAALHLEDQVAPKRCGHIAGKQVIPAREFAEKIRAAVEYRTDADFVIIARTDARAVAGLDDAIARGNLYREAGADVIFVEAPQTEDEIQRVAREVKGPLLSNMVIGGKTPSVKFSELERLGYKIVIYPAVCMAAAIPAMERALALLKERGTDWHEGPALSPMDVFTRVGFDWWSEIERRFGGHP
jgi:carboxyvinyl-carboxyphosphonate phosphorylmutase